jgi:DNA-binding NtrC family response regulator
MQQLNAPRSGCHARAAEPAAPIKVLAENGNVRPLEEIERDVIRLALSKSGGCVTTAAKQLRMGRSTLYRKLPELTKDQ